MTGTPLLQVQALERHYPGARTLWRRAAAVKAVDGVDFELAAGETLAIVGESGCGKSTLARVIAGLDAPTAGSVRLGGALLAARSGAQRRAVARRVQIVFQDPYSSLNPRMRVEDIVAEPLEAQQVPRAQRRAQAGQLLAAVGLPPEAGRRLPHQFSGGQRQRIAIARALSVQPQLLVLDEPVSALDVSVRAQVLNLLAELKRAQGIASVLISHDMSAVQHLADRVAVMYLGRIVEIGAMRDVFERPAHPYTRTLLAAIPRLGVALEARAGEAPTAVTPGSAGCSFAPRCLHAQPRCRDTRPTLQAHAGVPHPVACHRASELPPHGGAPEAAPAPRYLQRLALLRPQRMAP